ncbi:putative reverse transcriptase, RNA-dependent DNA polymerase, partial [Tanacetum coccineum]
LLPLLYDSPQSSKNVVADDAGKKTNEELANEGERNGQEKEGEASNKEDDQNVQDFRVALDNLLVKQKKGYANSTNRDSTVCPSVTANLLNTGIFSGAYDDEDVGAEADLNNLETTMNVSPIPITKIHKDHPKDQIIGDINLATQTRRMTKIFEELAMHAIRTKWVYRNKKDERGIVVRNKARLVAQGYTQEKGIDYDEDGYEECLLYGSIEEEVYVCQPPGFEDLQFPNKVYKVMRKDDGIFISQYKYVVGILKKFDFVIMKTTSTPIETNKALLKDEEAEDVDVHLYRSMIGSLMYLTASRPDIMFVVCACARFQVTPKVSHLHAVKRIFRYLKGQPKLGLWYPRDSPFDLEAFSDSDYAGASLDRKSTTGGCQFLGKRLISWQCKKQTVVANSTTEAEYVAAANCCGQNPVFHSKTKHIEIRHHFIRDSYEKKLIQFVDQHNMVACLERTEENAEFHQIVELSLLLLSFLCSKLKLVHDDRPGAKSLGGAIALTRLRSGIYKHSYDSPILGSKHTGQVMRKGMKQFEIFGLGFFVTTNTPGSVHLLEGQHTWNVLRVD